LLAASFMKCKICIMRKTISSCPAWLRISEDRRSLVLDAQRASVVTLIFEEAASGIGAGKIAQRLNEKMVAPFGIVPWQQSTISNMLTNRAVFGEFQRKVRANRKRLPVGEVIPRYYPAVIDEALFEKAQFVRRQNLQLNRGGKGKSVSNLFAGVIRCLYCGSRMKMENVSASSNQKLTGQNFVCGRAFVNKGCAEARWPRQDFEKVFFSCIQNIAQSPYAAAFQSKAIFELNRDKTSADIYQKRSAVASKIKFALSSVDLATLGDDDVHLHSSQTRSQNILYVANSRYFRIRFLTGDEFLYFSETVGLVAATVTNQSS
jgi:hypothetical protein